MLRKPLIQLIRLYQAGISPFLGRWCRFEPSCSEYACQAIALHGPFRGSWLGLKRILRCQPFCQGGWDPVPPPRGDATPCGCHPTPSSHHSHG